MYPGRWVQTVPPTAEPVTVEEAKAHLRLDGVDHDVTVANLVMVARLHVEAITRRALLTQTWALSLDAWPDEILLPRPPLLAVTSITYKDTAGATQTLAADQYTVLSQDIPARIVRAYQVVWPSLYSVPNAVTVTYTAGYGATRATVPADLRHAVLLLVGQWFEHTEPTTQNPIAAVPFALDALLAPHRVFA